MQSFEVQTQRRVVFVDITSRVRKAGAALEITDGALLVFVPHTTAGVTINENADPSVRDYLEMALARLVPSSLPFTHAEGNSDAHVKASLMGSSAQVIVSNGRLKLGTWQGIFFCEFDGPRSRRVWVACS